MRTVVSIALALSVILAAGAVSDRSAEAARSITTILVFTASWCTVCEELDPVLDRAAEAAGGSVHLVRVDVERHPGVSDRYGIQVVPTVLALRHGEPTYWFIGEASDLEVGLFIRHVTSR